eukprot:Hpha_TRINITY_DN16906_c1_g1::TRINITY_DN16906_c1_g1_i1::g.55210::m.55210
MQASRPDHWQLLGCGPPPLVVRGKAGVQKVRVSGGPPGLVVRLFGRADKLLALTPHMIKPETSCLIGASDRSFAVAQTGGLLLVWGYGPTVLNPPALVPSYHPRFPFGLSSNQASFSLWGLAASPRSPPAAVVLAVGYAADAGVGVVARVSAVVSALALVPIAGVTGKLRKPVGYPHITCWGTVHQEDADLAVQYAPPIIRIYAGNAGFCAVHVGWKVSSWGGVVRRWVDEAE